MIPSLAVVQNNAPGTVQCQRATVIKTRISYTLMRPSCKPPCARKCLVRNVLALRLTLTSPDQLSNPQQQQQPEDANS